MIRFVLSVISVNLYNDQTRCFVDRMGKYFSSLLEPGKLVEAIKKALDQQQKPNSGQLKRNLLVRAQRVGSMSSDSAATSIRIESRFIPENRLSALADVVQDFLAKE